jgi:hypothetical protein
MHEGRETERAGSLFSPFSCVLREGREAERGVDVLDFVWFLYHVFLSKANFHYFDDRMVCSYELYT